MAHLHRFFIEPASSPAVGAQLSLSAEEAHHALRVVRVREGDTIGLFDGYGHAFTAVIKECTRRDVHAEITETHYVEAPAAPLTVAQAWLHRDKAVEHLIQQGVVLGIDTFCFFRAQHSERAPKLSPKWRRLAIEACKQCGRVRLPEFHVCASTEEMLTRTPGAHLVATMDAPPVPLHDAVPQTALTVILGPEGDFSDEELTLLLQRGATPISLGQTTFRAEAAAIAATTLLQYERGQLGPLPS